MEMAWGWWRFQPESERSPGDQARVGPGSARLRQMGMVALARQWLSALWRFLETGVLPKGASLNAAVRIR
jgi:transposase